MATWILTKEEKLLLKCCVCHNLTKDPVLLPCLCSSCRGCVDTMRRGDKIECPSCKEKFQANLLQSNTYISVQIAAHTARDKNYTCSVCEEDGYAETTLYRCHECQYNLCQKCSVDHRRHMRHHNLGDLSSYLNGTHAIALSRAGTCEEHKHVVTIFCELCKHLKCAMCMKVCLIAKHDIVAVDEHLATIVKEIKIATKRLTNESVTTGDFEQLIHDANSSRKKLLLCLEENKIKLLDKVTEKYIVPKAAVEEHHNDIVVRAEEALEAVRLLNHRIEHSTAYAKAVADSADAVSLVNQQHLILARLQSLVHDKLKAPTSIVVNKMVIDFEHLENIGNIIERSVGIPKLFDVFEKGQAKLRDEQQTKREEQEDLRNANRKLRQDLVSTQLQLKEEQQKANDEKQALERQLAELKGLQQKTRNELEELKTSGAKLRQGHEHRLLQEEQNTSPTQDKCISLVLPHILDAPRDISLLDVAVASDGAVFLATSQGVKEYNSRGQEVSQPLTDGNVYSLDVFSDGRVAAGLEDSSVAILSREATQQGREWKVTASFKTKVSPYSLAVAEDGSCISVATGWGTGCVLYVYSCSGWLLMKKNLGYRIRSLASSTEAVVISSWHKRELPLEGHSVEAYDYSDQLLWQHTSSDMAWDLCPDPRNRLVYTTVYRKNGVRVLKGEGQQETEEDVVRGSEALEEPAYMSMDREGRYLAVICGYKYMPRTVTVFSVLRR